MIELALANCIKI